MICYLRTKKKQLKIGSIFILFTTNNCIGYLRSIKHIDIPFALRKQMNFGITVLYDALRMKYFLLFYKTDRSQTNEQFTALLCITKV